MLLTPFTYRNEAGQTVSSIKPEDKKEYEMTILKVQEAGRWLRADCLSCLSVLSTGYFFSKEAGLLLAVGIFFVNAIIHIRSEGTHTARANLLAQGSSNIRVVNSSDIANQV